MELLIRCYYEKDFGMICGVWVLSLMLGGMLISGFGGLYLGHVYVQF